MIYPISFSIDSTKELHSCLFENKADLIFKQTLKNKELCSLKLLLQKFEAISLEEAEQPLFKLFTTIIKEFDHIRGIVLEHRFMSVDKSG